MRYHHGRQFRHKRMERNRGILKERIARTMQNRQIKMGVALSCPHTGKMLAASGDSGANMSAIPHTGVGSDSLRIVPPATAGQGIGMGGTDIQYRRKVRIDSQCVQALGVVPGGLSNEMTAAGGSQLRSGG